MNPDGPRKEEEQGHGNVQLGERDLPSREVAVRVLLGDVNLQPVEDGSLLDSTHSQQSHFSSRACVPVGNYCLAGEHAPANSTLLPS